MNESKTDWNKLKNMSDEEIIINAESDPDCPIMTDEELKEMKPVNIIHAGRPTKYSPDLIEKILELGQKGFNKIEIAASLKINRKTLDRWAHEHDEFKEALETALDWSHANFSLQMKAGMLGQIPHFNSGAAALIARNQHGWNDGNTTNTINIQNMQYASISSASTEELSKKLEQFKLLAQETSTEKLNDESDKEST